MEISPQGDIYLGMNGFNYPGGIYRSSDNAQTWEYLGLDELPVYAIEVCANGDILTGVFAAMYKSTDNGESWYEVYHEVLNVSVIKSLSNGYVFAGGGGNLHGILLSTDFGETWDTAFVFTNYGQENLKSLAVSDDGNIWAGSTNMFGEGSIWFTTDLGDTWTNMESPCTYTQTIALAFHPQGDLYAGFYGEGFYRYNFTSQEWTALYFTGISPDDFLFVGNNKIFVAFEENPGNWGGVLYSEDGGLTFEWINSGLYGGGVETSINILIRHPNNIIFAEGLGFYRSILPVYTKIDSPNEHKAEISYNLPNPFKEKTIICWDKAGNDKYLKFILHDNSGKTLLNILIENTGRYVLQAGGLTPGLLYYSIQGRDACFSGKMVLVN
ncbi:MAG: hypothetical protein JW731_02335 [Bacteroidales bacterium]|nr:hypothetical protein [Bacteroidales bacterium]